MICVTLFIPSTFYMKIFNARQMRERSCESGPKLAPLEMFKDPWCENMTGAHRNKLKDQTEQSYMIWLTIHSTHFPHEARQRLLREELRCIPLRQLNVINSNAIYLPCIINAAV